MSDNTILNQGQAGDVIRDIDRQATGIKTQVVQLDLGGSASNAEKLITAGQNTMANSVPVVLSSDQSGVPVTGTFYQATQPISYTQLPLVAGSANIGTVNIGTLPTLTKGTQDSTGFSTQDLKDAGRVIHCYSADNFTGTAAEALVTLTPVVDGVSGTPATSFTVTSGKRLRIQAISLTAQSPSNASISTLVHLRITSTGAATATSPTVAVVGVGVSGTLTVLGTDNNALQFPDGVELSGSMQFCITQKSSASSGFYVNVVGYEY